MGMWEDFHEDWRVYDLLQFESETEGTGRETVERAISCQANEGHPNGVDRITGYLGGALLDAVRVQSFALGIAIQSAWADVSVIPLVQASAEVPGDQPWIRYKVSLDAETTAEQLTQLHQRVQATCVRRFESEYEVPIAGSIISTRSPDQVE